MKNFRIVGLAEDSKIESIGTLYRRIDGSQWNINVDWTPRQKKTSLSISNATLLARRRVLNSTIERKPAGYHLEFTILNTESWETKKLSEYPIREVIRKSEENELCFCFETDGITYYMPQFELARALFFHEAYFARTALISGYLHAEFDIQRISRESAIINILRPSGYPHDLLQEDHKRMLFSWILLDPQARASFESISRYQMLNGEEAKGYRKWRFQFDAPFLPETKFVVRGQFDRERNCMLIFEIYGIENISADVPAIVQIYHPLFKDHVRGENMTSSPRRDSYYDSNDLHDGETPNANGKQVVLSAPTIEFGFSKAFITKRISKTNKVGATGRTEEDIGAEGSGEVSTDESSVVGSMSRAAWCASSDKTNEVEIYASKFESFKCMLEVLLQFDNCQKISESLIKLPPYSQSQKHLLADGKPRYMAVVEIDFNGRIFQILEIDTSDAIKPLSTMLLKRISKGNWKYELEGIQKMLLRKTLRWPKSEFERLCGKEGFAGIPHPRTSSDDKGQLEKESVSKWATRFHSWMQRF